MRISVYNLRSKQSRETFMQWDGKQMAALAAAADSGSFEQAAAQLRITPSAVSQRIRALEEAAGALLLTRSRPCRPTEHGRRLLRYWRQVMSLQQELDNELQQQSSQLALAANHDSLDTWLLPLLAEAAAEEQLLLDIQAEDQEHTRALMAEGRVMAAVSSEAAPIHGCEAYPLGSLRYRLMAAPDFAERYFSDGLSPTALRRAPLLVFNRKDNLQADFLRTHLQADAAMCPTHYIPSSYAFFQAVCLGLGYGACCLTSSCKACSRKGGICAICAPESISMCRFSGIAGRCSRPNGSVCGSGCSRRRSCIWLWIRACSPFITWRHFGECIRPSEIFFQTAFLCLFTG